MPIATLPLANALFNLASAAVALLVAAFARRAFSMTGGRNLIYTSLGFGLFAVAEATAAVGALYVLFSGDPTPERAGLFELSLGTFYFATTLGFLALVIAHLPARREPVAAAIVPGAAIVISGFLNFVLAFIVASFAFVNYVEKKSRNALLMGVGFALMLAAQLIFLIDGLSLGPPDLVADAARLSGYVVIALVLRRVKAPG
jgi:hypothetical protein